MLDTLSERGGEEELKKHGYTLGHFPQSWELSTLGGWVASRSSGQQSLHYGRIENMFAGGTIETLNGTMTIPTIPASSAGPDVREMILGSEGRMGIITEVAVRITPLPEKEKFQVVFFPSWQIGISAARELIQQRVALSMVRLSNPLETTSLLYMGAGSDSSGVVALEESLSKKGIGEGKVMMTFGVTGSARHCDAAYQLALDHCSDLGGVADESGLGENWAHGRFRAPYLRDPLGAEGYVVDTMETAIDWSKVSEAAENIEQAIRTALDDEGEQVHAYTHLSHVYGQGSSIYTTYLFRIGESYEQGMNRWMKLKKAGADQRKQYSHIADKYKEDNGTPIFRQKVRYHLTGAGKKVHAVTGTCFQFPLKLAFAITGHKMQGQTIKTGSKLVVNWSNILPSGLAYVMCSRTESIDDLYIAGQFNPKKIQANPKALTEAKRLDEISLANRPETISPLNQLLGFGFVNIRSLNANFEFLEDDELMKELDVIFVTETWMDSKSKRTYKLDGYNSAFANGKTARGKGN